MEITTFVWMFLVLKIPIVAALVLVWWAIKEPERAGSGEDDGGSLQEDGRDPHPRKPGPRGRGPHGVHPVGAPRRVRIAVRGRLARHGR